MVTYWGVLREDIRAWSCEGPDCHGKAVLGRVTEKGKVLRLCKECGSAIADLDRTMGCALEFNPNYVEFAHQAECSRKAVLRKVRRLVRS